MDFSSQISYHGSAIIGQLSWVNYHRLAIIDWLSQIGYHRLAIMDQLVSINFQGLACLMSFYHDSQSLTKDLCKSVHVSLSVIADLG